MTRRLIKQDLDVGTQATNVHLRLRLRSVHRREDPAQLVKALTELSVLTLKII